MQSVTLGVALCGSFCTYKSVFSALQELKAHYPNLVPILSENSAATDSRFGTARSHMEALAQLCGRPVRSDLASVEPIGPKKELDLLLIAPCTGNTIAKLACGIADTAVTLAAKAHLRNERPIVIAVSTNDGLGANARNIGQLMARKHIYFVPFGQDDPQGKPCSLVADMSLIEPTVTAALQGIQLQPVLIDRRA